LLCLEVGEDVLEVAGVGAFFAGHVVEEAVEVGVGVCQGVVAISVGVFLGDEVVYFFWCHVVCLSMRSMSRSISAAVKDRVFSPFDTNGIAGSVRVNAPY